MVDTVITVLSIFAITANGWATSGDKKDIVDTAVAAGSFNTLAKALTAAGLVATLKSKGPFTVFAPTDDAFAKLPAGTLEDLLKPENKEKLKGILYKSLDLVSAIEKVIRKWSGCRTEQYFYVHGHWPSGGAECLLE